MRRTNRFFSTKYNFINLLLILALFLCTFLSHGLDTNASEHQVDELKKVRVGYCYFEGYNDRDEEGRYFGYGYDFLQKIAPYANFEYEYVGMDKRWDECLTMLENGEIDIMTPVHYTSARSEQFEFTKYTIGSSAIILTARADDARFEAGAPSSYDGIIIGSMVGNSCDTGLAEYANANGFSYSEIQYPSEQEMFDAFDRGEVDALLTRDFRSLRNNEIILSRFYQDSVYAVAKKNNRDIIDRVDDAIARLDISSPLWREELYKKNYYNDHSSTDLTLSESEKQYLKKLQREAPLKVMFNPDRAPYSYLIDGEPCGMFYDLFISLAEELNLNYEIIKVNTTSEYNKACDAGMPDVIFDCPSTDYVAESKGYYLSKSYYDGEFAILQQKGKKDLQVVAVKRGALGMNSRYEIMYGDKTLLECDSLDECVKQVRDGMADCCFMYLYTAANYVTDDYTGKLEYIPIHGMHTSFAIATKKGHDTELYSIMNKYADSISTDQINPLIAKHRKTEQINIVTYIYRNPIEFLSIVVTILGVILFTIVYWRHLRREEDRKKDSEIRTLKSMMDRMTDSFPIGILSYTMDDHKILLANRETCQIFGVNLKPGDTPENGTLNKNILKEDLPNIRDAASRLRQVGDKVEYIFRIQLRDKTIAHILCTTKLLAFDDGRKYILSGIRNYTDRVLANTRLKQEQAQFRDALLVNANFSFSFDVTEGYLTEEVITTDGRLLLDSVGLKPPIKYDFLVEAYKGNIVFNGDTIDCFSCAGIEKMYAEGRNAQINEYYLIKQDSYCQMQVLMYRDASNNHLMATVINTDITEARKDEIRQKQLLKDALAATDRANEAKTEFMSHMSHDIRTPMNAIIGMNAIAMAHIDDSDRVKKCLNSIDTSSRHLLTLINEVLDMSKIEAGKIELQEENFNLSDLIDNLMDIIRVQLNEKKHSLDLDIDNIQHKNLVGDMSKIQQIFMNLMSNAIKYTPEGGRIRLSITEMESGQDNIACFEWVFEDNGIGMSEEFAKKVFEPFSREEDSRISKIQGTGLGMAIVKNLVTMMNGTIEVVSELNKGTKFIVNIHLKIQNEADIKDTEPKLNELEDIIRTDYSDKRALLVEDNELNAEIATEILKMTGMQIELASNGKEALEKVQNSPDGYYDIVFMDIQMPVMDGYEATRNIRAIGREYTDRLPILAMTANAFVEDVEASRAAGMNAHIAKPLEFKILLDNLETWLT